MWNEHLLRRCVEVFQLRWTDKSLEYKINLSISFYYSFMMMMILFLISCQNIKDISTSVTDNELQQRENYHEYLNKW